MFELLQSTFPKRFFWGMTDRKTDRCKELINIIPCVYAVHGLLFTVNVVFTCNKIVTILSNTIYTLVD